METSCHPARPAMLRSLLVLAATTTTTALRPRAATPTTTALLPRAATTALRATTIDVEAVAVEPQDDAVAAAKKDLLDAIAGTDRGFTKNKDEADEVRRAIDALAAARAGKPEPLATANWTLAWTDAPDILNLAGGPLSTLGRIGQEVDADAGTVVNVIEWGPSKLAAALRKDLADDLVQQRVITGFTQSDETVTLVLKGAGVRPRRVFGKDVGERTFDGVGPLSLPFGEFTVLYNDGDVRCVRTGQGYLSVNVKMI